MNKKTLGLLKIAYSKVISIPPVGKAKDSYVASKKEKKVKAYEARLNSLYGPYGSLELDETNFRLVELEQSSSDYLAGFDILGSIGHISPDEALSLSQELEVLLDDKDVAFRLSISDDSCPEFTVLEEKLDLYTLSDEQSYIFKTGDFTIAAIGMNVLPEHIVDGKLKPQVDTIKNLAYAKSHADYTIIYALNTCQEGYEKVITKGLVDLGVDQVFISSNSPIKVGEATKRGDGAYTYSCPSLGTLSPDGNLNMVLRHKLIQVPNRKEYLLNKCYLPVLDGQVTNYQLCKDNPKVLDKFKEIENGKGSYHHIDEILTIDDICRIIGAKLPSQYEYMGKVSAGKVTTHWPDSVKGDVLFFNEAYSDVNDVIGTPLKVRLRVVEKAIEKGICFCFSCAPLEYDIPHMVLESPMESHITLCAKLRERYPITTIGITGSIGKTSTKDMLYNVLNQHFDTDRNLRNTNTQVNIGLHIQGYKPWQEMYIQEIGGGRKGGASRHSRMILPQAACVTNIGDAHIGNHGSREALMINKLGIVDGLAEGGILYLNGDDPLLSKAKVDAKVVYYAIDNKEADYYADNIRQIKGQVHFDICHGNERTPVYINVLGEHNVLNAVCCFAIAKQFGIPDEEIREGLAQFKTSGARQNYITVDGYNLFVDCFNASPASIDSSLSVLDAIDAEGKKKIAVVGDVTGMAGMATKVHEDIGQMVLNHKMDILVCYGKNSKIVYKTAKENGINAYSFTKPAELMAFLKKTMDKGDVILFKGSSKMKLAQIIDKMFGTIFTEQMFMDSAKTKKYSQGGIEYSCCPAFALVKGCTSVNPNIVIEDKVKRKTVWGIDQEVFKDNQFIQSIKFGTSLRHIGDRAFSGCTNLKDVYLPDGLMYLGEDVFKGCPNVTVHVTPGSNAEKLYMK